MARNTATQGTPETTAQVEGTQDEMSLAQAWAQAYDAMVDGKTAENAKELRKSEAEARKALWAAVGKDRTRFDELLVAVGKPVSKPVEAPPPTVPMGRTRAGGTREPYVPKRDWEPAVGQKVRVKLYDPSDFEDAVLVGQDKYGRMIAYIEGRGRRPVTKSRIYPVRNLDATVATVDLAELPEAARTPEAWEAKLQPTEA